LALPVSGTDAVQHRDVIVDDVIAWSSLEPDGIECGQEDKREHRPDRFSLIRVNAKGPQKTENVSGMNASTAARAVRTTGLDL
jgi:hypothetical protein